MKPETHAYDWRKGGHLKRPKKRASAGKLTAAKRNTLAESTFGLPGERAYPMPDKKHARLAKSGASHAEHVGNISQAEQEQIDAKADRILGRGKKGKR